MAVANYQVTDGGKLDMDGEVNGRIEDPAGIASEVSSIGSLANTGQSTTLFVIIAGLMALTSSTLLFVRRKVLIKA